MSKEYIEREAAVDALKSLPFQWDVEDLAVYEAIEEVPTADVAPVVHGEWKQGKYLTIRCSLCDAEAGERPIDYDDCEYIFSPYCPNCGAKMDGGNSNA